MGNEPSALIGRSPLSLLLLDLSRLLCVHKGVTRFLRSLKWQIVPAYFEVKMRARYAKCVQVGRSANGIRWEVCVCVCVCVCLSHLVDLLFGVCEQVGKVREDITVEHHLSLLIRPCYNVPHRSQRRSLNRGYTNTFRKWLHVVFNVYKWFYFYLNFDLLVAEQWNKEGDDTWVYYHLNLLVTSICQIRQSPHCVYQNLEGDFSV